MNLLAFNYEYPPLGGGGGVAFEQIMTVLARRHHVTVVTSAEGRRVRVEREGNLEIHRVPVLGRRSRSTASMISMLSYWPRSWRYGRRLLNQRRFDLINSHFVVPSAPSADQLARRFGLPHALSIHGGDIYDPSKRVSPHRLPGVRTLVRRLLNRADAVVAQSRNTAAHARRFYGTRRPIEIIPLGIEPMPPAEPDRPGLGLEPNRFVIATVGRLIARKAVEELIRVLADLDDPNDRLLVIGDGPKRAEWEALARQLGVAPRVRFTGFLSERDKARHLASADLLASTSRHEGFGLVFLEGMDMGLPVVAYDYGGQTDFLRQGETGGLVELGNRDQFRQEVRTLKDDPEKRARIAAHNREAVKDYYLQRCAQRYEAVFESLLRRGEKAEGPEARRHGETEAEEREPRSGHAP